MFKARTADRADDLLGKLRDRRADAVAVRAQVRAQPRHHQPQDVQGFGHGPDDAAPSRNRRPLQQSKSGREVIDPVHVGALYLGQPAAAVGAQAGEVPLHALGIQGAEGQRRLARPGHPYDGHRAPQRHVDVDVAQVVIAARRARRWQRAASRARSISRHHITYLSSMARPRRDRQPPGPGTRTVIRVLRGGPDRSGPCRGAATA